MVMLRDMVAVTQVVSVIPRMSCDRLLCDRTLAENKLDRIPKGW